MIANKVVEDVRRQKKSAVIIKVGHEKAYDFARWECLYYMMARLGFQEKWISWIKGYLEASSFPYSG